MSRNPMSTIVSILLLLVFCAFLPGCSKKLTAPLLSDVPPDVPADTSGAPPDTSTRPSVKAMTAHFVMENVSQGAKLANEGAEGDTVYVDRWVNWSDHGRSNWQMAGVVQGDTIAYNYQFRFVVGTGDIKLQFWVMHNGQAILVTDNIKANGVLITDGRSSFGEHWLVLHANITPAGVSIPNPQPYTPVSTLEIRCTGVHFDSSLVEGNVELSGDERMTFRTSRNDVGNRVDGYWDPTDMAFHQFIRCWNDLSDDSPLLLQPEIPIYDANGNLLYWQQVYAGVEVRHENGEWVKCDNLYDLFGFSTLEIGMSGGNPFMKRPNSELGGDICIGCTAQSRSTSEWNRIARKAHQHTARLAL